MGIPLLHFYGIESLLYKYGVDLHIQAHEHSYERMWPVYNLVVGTLFNNSVVLDVTLLCICYYYYYLTYFFEYSRNLSN